MHVIFLFFKKICAIFLQLDLFTKIFDIRGWIEKKYHICKKKNFFLHKLSILLEKDGFILRKISDFNEISFESSSKVFVFFYLESKEFLSELKKLQKLKNLNLVIFKNQELSLPNNFNWAAQINLPLVYNDLVLELKRINEVTKINKRKYKLGDFFF